MYSNLTVQKTHRRLKVIQRNSLARTLSEIAYNAFLGLPIR